MFDKNIIIKLVNYDAADKNIYQVFDVNIKWALNIFHLEGLMNKPLGGTIRNTYSNIDT